MRRTPRSSSWPIFALLDILGIERACVGGLSMGGNIALRFALAHPERVDGLVIANAGAGSDDPPEWRQRWLGIAALLERRGVDAFIHAFEASPFVARYVSQGPHAAAFLRRLLGAQRSGALARTARGVQAARPPVHAFEASLRALHVPTLVISGEHDALTLSPSRFLAATLPEAELTIIAGAAHLTNLEAPDAFNTAVERFLSAVWGSRNGPTLASAELARGLPGVRTPFAP